MSVSLIVARPLVKQVKTILEDQGCLDRSHKIKSVGADGGVDGKIGFLIPARLPEDGYRQCISKHQDDQHHQRILNKLGLSTLAGDIKVQVKGSVDMPTEARKRNPLGAVIEVWMQILPSTVLEILFSQSQTQASSPLSYISNIRYNIYEPLLLLAPEFSPFVAIDSKEYRLHLEILHEMICQRMNITHIAIKGLILPTVPSVVDGVLSMASSQDVPNILRSPSNFMPLYGDFGPMLRPDKHPSNHDFASAFWCSSRQNGITQIWAPRYTMFSRGNISEKTRVLKLDTLKHQWLGCSAAETTAVDLYAGIGYFAFSYLKAGVGKVLCWDMNPWSLEGLRKGAECNRWKAMSFLEDGPNTQAFDEAKILAFEETNECAASRVESIRDQLHPVRHVNCGYLPSSKGSWETAVQMLDPRQGGWVHAHENVAKNEIESRAVEIVAMFKEFTRQLQGAEKEVEVECEHIERVKSYAPGVFHCVYDIAITPNNAAL